VTTDVSILGAPLVVMGLTRLWAGARAANYLWPFFNIVISNVSGPRQTMYCLGAPATHYFPVSIPYHGCALNITMQSYLDQLDFGLIACSETVPDAQRIADFIVEDFAAMRKADADLDRAETIETIAVALTDAPVAEPKIEAPEPKANKASALTREIEALSTATEALLRKVKQKRSPAARAKPPPVKPNVAKAGKRASSKARPAKRASDEASVAPSVKRRREAPRARRKSRAPAQAGE
jgi:diacylglycerol O-acyltransferase / wax synthase